jgi:hypothetical protein
MTREEMWAATEITPELNAAIDKELDDGYISTSSVAYLIVEKNIAENALRDVPWDALEGMAKNAMGDYLSYLPESLKAWIESNKPKEKK